MCQAKNSGAFKNSNVELENALSLASIEKHVISSKIASTIYI